MKYYIINKQGKKTQVGELVYNNIRLLKKRGMERVPLITENKIPETVINKIKKPVVKKEQPKQVIKKPVIKKSK